MFQKNVTLCRLVSNRKFIKKNKKISKKTLTRETDIGLIGGLFTDKGKLNMIQQNFSVAAQI